MATPILQERYQQEIVPALMDEFGYKNVMQVPRVEKLVVNIGVGEALDNAKALDGAVEDLRVITGQQPVITRAKKSIATFKLREGRAIGVKVTLRGERMWSLLDRLIRETPAYLVPGGRLLFTLFGFLGVEGAKARLRAAGLDPVVVAHERHGFPRIGFERLDHLRAMDAEGTIPRDRLPDGVDRYVIAGYARR